MARLAHWGLLLMAGLSLMQGMPAEEPAATLGRARELEARGEFREAEALLAAAVRGEGLPAAARRDPEFEAERLRRIRLDYSHTRASLIEALRQAVRDFRPAEFDRWHEQDWFDGRPIDGTLRFVGTSVGNLFWRHPELRPRRLKGGDERSLSLAYWRNAHEIRRAARRGEQPYVLPKRFAVTMTLEVPAGTVPAGERLRAWLPIPRRYAFQDQFALLRSQPEGAVLAGPDSPIRSAYLEQGAAKGPTVFQVQYAYTAWGVSFDLRSDRVRPSDPADARLRPFTQEGPHVVFTDAMRQLAGELAGNDDSPVTQARRFYDWIGEHIQYSFAREYSTILNLGDYCLAHRYGDCGQEALLFITLCRLRGIPARWQAGWTIFPGAENLHDWCEIHLAPYGWVPVDPYMGIYAARYSAGLDAAQRQELRDFYFGGLSQYRLIANSDHCQALEPPKRTFRSDTVDFQRGEVETSTRNLYFGEWKYGLRWKEVPTTPPRASGPAPPAGPPLAPP